MIDISNVHWHKCMIRVHLKHSFDSDFECVLEHGHEDMIPAGEDRR